MWRDDHAVAVGPVLLIGIAVSLAAIAGITSAIVRDSADPTQISDVEGDARFVDGDHHVALRQGELPVSKTFLRITVDGVASDTPLSWWIDQPTWRPGQWICIAGDGPSCAHPAASSVQVSAWGPDGFSFSLGSLDGLAEDAPVVVYKGTRPSFYVNDDGGIVVQCTGDATLRIIGVEITNGPGGAAIPVYAKVTTTGGPPYMDPFGGAVAAGMSHPFGAIEGAVLGVHGRATGFGFDEQYTSFDDDPHVLTLVDGDEGPAFQPYGNQIGIGPLLAPYVDATGHIVLEQNEAIVLFEFNPSLSSAAADFQDLVVLFEFEESSC